MPEVKKRIHVLVVHELPIVLWALEQLFKVDHAAIVVAGQAVNTAAAVELAQKLQPDVILLQIQRDDGSHVLAALPALKAVSNASILLLSDASFADKEEAAILAGARGLLNVNSTPTDYLKAIRKVHAGELWLNRATTSRIFIKLGVNGGNGGNGNLRSDASKPEASLSIREREVVTTLADHPDESISQLARKLYISEHTLRNHLTAVYHKLGVSNRLQLFVYSTTHGLTENSSVRK